MALKHIRYGEPTAPDEQTAYAIAYRTNRNGDEHLELARFDLTALETLDWIDEHTSGHTIYAAGDDTGELEDYIDQVDFEAESEAIAEDTVLTAREAQAYTLTEHYGASRANTAKIMGIEPSTVSTLKQRAEAKIEKARATVDWQ